MSASLTFPKKQDRGFFSWPPARTPPSSGDDQTCIQGSTPKQRIQNRDPNSSSHVGEYRVPGSGRKYSPLEKAQGVEDLLNNLIPSEHVSTELGVTNLHAGITRSRSTHPCIDPNHLPSGGACVQVQERDLDFPSKHPGWVYLPGKC